VSLPTADDLFRSTGKGGAEHAVVRAVPDDPSAVSQSTPIRPDLGRPDLGRSDGVRSELDPSDLERSALGTPRPSGRVRHDEKMTVYVTSSELVRLEQARLRLRAEHGIAVDRGRLVREALAVVLEQFESEGDESTLVRLLADD
jgi:hypothetical protein